MLSTEAVHTFAELTRKLPSFNGKRIHVSTLHRWCQRGVRGVRLEHRRLGGRMVTSLEAVDRFSARLAETVDEPVRDAEPTVQIEPEVRSASHLTKPHFVETHDRRRRRRRTGRARSTAIERAERYLREHGA